MGSNDNNTVSVVILAAGKGTRMKSQLPKVLHQVASKPIIAHVLDAVYGVKGISKVVVVIAEDMDNVRKIATAVPVPEHCELTFVVQKERLGTGHAVKTALPHLEGLGGTTLTFLGDLPLVQSRTIQKLLDGIDENHQGDVNVLGFYAVDPLEYGRLEVNEDGTLNAIVEFKDATEAQRRNNLCNSGIIAVSNNHLPELVHAVKNNNSKGEYYLTDIVEIAQDKGLTCRYSIADEHEVMGINSREQLAMAEYLLQERLRRQAMDVGVTFVDPSSVFLATDTIFGSDVVIQPNVFFGPGVQIGSNVEIRAFSHIEGAVVADDVVIGPFARLRPGTHIAEHAHVGNFVEIKNAKIKEAAKINHLSYVGDAYIGARTNIGAGTITCNYDGFRKSTTTIGDDCFIGSDTCLIAPVTVGNGAIVGAGSIITQDIADNALGLSRPEQKVLDNKAHEYREKRQKPDK